MVHEIEEWLRSNRDYKAGTAIYLKYGTNETLGDLFQRGATIYTTTRLLKELVLLNKQTHAPAPVEKKILPVKKETPVDYYDSMPDDIQSLYREARYLSQINAAAQSKLVTLVEMAMEKYDRQTEIKKINDFLLSNGSERLCYEHLISCRSEGKLWEKIDYWRKHGKLPPEVIIPDVLMTMDMHSLMGRKQVIASRISQLKRKKNKKREIKRLQDEKLIVERRIRELI